MPKEQNTEKPKTEDKLNGNGKKGKVILLLKFSAEVQGFDSTLQTVRGYLSQAV